MEVRVVCGLSATMATFCPTSALSRVDLPALGRPMMETNPERKVLLMRHGLRFANADLIHAQVVAGQDLHADAVALDGFAGFGDAAEPLADQAADGSGLDILFPAEGIHQLGNAADVETSGDDETAGTV